MVLRILVATDAWHPQVNGVVQTYSSLVPELAKLDVDLRFLTPQDFRSFPMPGYPGIRLALARKSAALRRLDYHDADAVHIATEGPIGWAMRAACITRGIRFTTGFHTRFPEYIAARAPVPVGLTYAIMRHFHNAGAGIMAPTPSIVQALEARGFNNVRLWGRGVDPSRFRPEAGGRAGLDHPHPIFLSVGRLAKEKNLDAFLSLSLPGTKLVVGDGPDRARLEATYPDAIFIGEKPNTALPEIYAAADVFVFPSLTDTFGLVLIEALASGTPVAAFPVPGPLDVVGGSNAGVLDTDLRLAALGALRLSREDCRAHAENFTWAASARQFRDNVLLAETAQPAGSCAENSHAAA
jgi:glycosyltransferase involved in cell wall biosynthesis